METLEPLANPATVLLSTRRKDGRIVHTPINFAVDDQGFGYFRSWPGSGKVKRLANFPGVRVCRCSRNGHPQSSDQPALAIRLDGAEAEHARTALATKYPRAHGRLGSGATRLLAGVVASRRDGIAARVDRIRHGQAIYYRLEPTEEPTPWNGRR